MFPIFHLVVVLQLFLETSNTRGATAGDYQIMNFTTDKHKFVSVFVDVIEDTFVRFQLTETG